MDRLALISATLCSLILGTNGALSMARVAARKGHNPYLGALIGVIVGFAGSLLTGIIIGSTITDQATVIGILSMAGGLILLAIVGNSLPDQGVLTGVLPSGKALNLNITARHIQGIIMRSLFIFAIGIALVALLTLMWTIVNKSVGLTAVQYAVEPEEIPLNGEPTGRPLEELTPKELGAILAENVRVARLRVFILEDVVDAPQTDWSTLSPQPVQDVLKGKTYDSTLAELPFNQLDAQQAAAILMNNLDRGDLETIIIDEIVQPEVVASWTLWESLANRSSINATAAEKFPKATLGWHSWINLKFLTSPLDPRQPDTTGIRPALIGSLMVIVITILIAFPIGVGAAVYLEEYAGKSRLNRIIQTNINNLAGVPSIIYGILGLAIFVRALDTITSGNAFGTEAANGRTVISASLTLALLILPLIIINAQEAIRAVPSSLRQASYGLGATQWQTIWNHVLPYAMPGILTGTILAISRAIGETAPLILVGGATYLTQDPKGPFSIFTALPLIIYRWTTLPQAEFRNAAAAAIVVLLLMLLTLNSIAVILRNRFSRRLS
jgi:phosphate transport system permease protein